ncbi:MAG: hypothetical protein RMX68_033010 [Aulosira sp. ZfuVER01]|nr:hypothetical protein [Aulosira sp. ZfuVER01]MDZ8000076.1 hypothetical protein [Aulosira sp. DedVER01a]MDZ8054990.1 hypothetical protein [Aulosira sp. ZfuCHP01]
MFLRNGGNEEAAEDKEASSSLSVLSTSSTSFLSYFFLMTVEVSDARPYKNQGTFDR